MIKNNLNKTSPAILNDYVPLMKPKETTEVAELSKTIYGFKMVIKAQDLVQLKINDCRASKSLLKRRSWRLV